MGLFQDIITTFKENSNPELVAPMKAYMKGRFEFFGIKSPQRRAISKPFMRQVKSLSRDEVFKLVEDLWNRPERELHYLSQELFFKAKKVINQEQDIEFLEWMVLNNSWWDTVDFIAPKLMKIYFDLYPHMRNEKVDQWIASDNIWLKRSAILLHLKQKDDVDLNYMFETILRLNETNEFFINKAIGWVLREHAKREPAKIISFVKKHEKSLSTLSVKEALKHHS